MMLVETLWAIFPLKSDDAINILISFVIWTSLYCIVERMPLPFKPKDLKVSKKVELDIKNREISLLHGCILIAFSTYEFYLAPGSCGDENTRLEKMLIYTAVGYFIYDFFAMAYYGLVD